MHAGAGLRGESTGRRAGKGKADKDSEKASHMRQVLTNRAEQEAHRHWGEAGGRRAGKKDLTGK
eukprot:4134822-Pleurochrysis_carterae.AAC.3